MTLFAVGVGADVGTKHQLAQSRAVAQIDEDAATQVAATLDPAEQDDLLTDVASAQLAGVVSP